MTAAVPTRTADAGVAARDPAVAGLGLLLDADAFVDVLARHAPELAIRGARSTYVRYKPGTSCLVAYEVTTERAPRPLQVYARAHTQSGLPKLDHAKRLAAIGGNLEPAAIVLEQAGIAVYSFPHDRRLRSLARLTDDGARHRILQRLVERAELGAAVLEQRRYKPERRFVAELAAPAEPPSARFVLKAYAGDFERALRNARAVQASDGLSVPRVVGRSRRNRLLAVEWLEGLPLDQTTADPGARGDFRAAGTALATLHRAPAAGLPGPKPSREVQRLKAAARAVAAVCPELAEHARGLARRIGPLLADSTQAAAPMHGDFTADQVLASADRVALIDFDEARRGDPAVDLGSFIAGLEREVLRGALAPGTADALGGEFLSGYEQTGGDLAGVRGWHVAAALLRLAPEPFRLREAAWPQRIQGLLDCAARRLDAELT